MEIGLLETVRISRHGRARAEGDPVVADRGPRLEDLNRIDHLIDRVQSQQTAPVPDVRLIDVVQKDAFAFQVRPRRRLVQVGAEHNAAPIARGRGGPARRQILPRLLVHPRREIDGTSNGLPLGVDSHPTVGVQQIGRSQHLQGAATAVDGQVRTTHADPRAAQLEDRPGVDHRCHALGHLHRLAVP